MAMNAPLVQEFQLDQYCYDCLIQPGIDSSPPPTFPIRENRLQSFEARCMLHA
jgi:hypothetical protein